MLKENEKIPAGLKGILVSTPDQEKAKPVSLSSLIKQATVVLYFYPKDNTPGCTTEALQFNEYLPKFHELGVQIIGISRDSVKSHCRFIEKKNLNFALLSDESGSITDSFGMWVQKSMYGKKYMGVQRSTYILEKGKVIKVFEKVNVKEHAAEVLEYLKNR